MYCTTLVPIFVIIIIGFVIFTNYSNNKEPFYNLPDTSENAYWDQYNWVGKRALDCYDLNKRDCMKYSNCGLCLKDGKQNCIPGDAQGPFFKQDCQGWQYTDYRDRYIFGEKVTYLTPPWSKFYPDYEARWVSPQSRATL